MGDHERSPVEVFLNVGKAGSDIAALAEAIGRLCSLCLRLPGELPAHERVRAIISQLAGIGGGRSSGFGAARVRSLPDAVARVLREVTERGPAELKGSTPGGTPTRRHDLCPACGQATLVHQEGCATCSCGFSEC